MNSVNTKNISINNTCLSDFNNFYTYTVYNLFLYCLVLAFILFIIRINTVYYLYL